MPQHDHQHEQTSHDGDHHGCAGEHKAAPPDNSALISARQIAFRRGGKAILQTVNLDLHSSEIVTLIGPNGAGKTTLVRMLLRLLQPDSGTIIRQTGLTIGYAPQRFDVDPVIPLTVARFIRLGQPSKQRWPMRRNRSGKGQERASTTPEQDHASLTAKIASTLAEVGADQLADRQLARLSGGELQRVILARALIRDPQLLVLDEPVRGVDFTGEAQLYELISQVRRARSVGVLLVSHDLHVVMAQSDRVICLNRHVCCSGVPQTVAQHPEYERLFGPLATKALGVYRHHHDHAHDLAGRAVPLPAAKPTPAASDEVTLPPRLAAQTGLAAKPKTDQS